MHHLSSRCIPCDGRLTASAYFDPRSPHGERRGWFRSNTAAVHFNPRSPQGSDNRPPYYALYYIIFQPTLPAWEATIGFHWRDDTGRFQSTLPAWGATNMRAYMWYAMKFQSTLPAWGATVQNSATGATGAISIHAPRMGSDGSRLRGARALLDFNPRSPHGERLPFDRPASTVDRFQSTLPAWGATGPCR